MRIQDCKAGRAFSRRWVEKRVAESSVLGAHQNESKRAFLRLSWGACLLAEGKDQRETDTEDES
jgi:hypothetical protein